MISTPVKVLGIENISEKVKAFTQKIMRTLESRALDFVGLDIAETDKGPYLIEVNRSPQFGAYAAKTHSNPVELLFQKA